MHLCIQIFNVTYGYCFKLKKQKQKHHKLMSIDPFHRVSNDFIKLFVVRHLGAQVTTGRYGQNKAFGYYCTFTVSDYGFVLFFYSGH